MAERKSFYLIAAGLAILLIVFGVGKYISVYEAKTNMQNAVDRILAEYPAIPKSFVSTKCCVRVDEELYFLIRNGNQIIAGHQSGDGLKTYFGGGYVWSVDQKNTLNRISEYEDHTSERIDDHITSLVPDASTKYTYKIPAGGPLPLWIYPTDPGYLLLQRQEFDSCMETMVYGENEGKAFFRWSIARSAEDVQLYFLVSEEAISGEGIILPGWGSIPSEIAAYLIN